jgi:hypothetical protein
MSVPCCHLIFSASSVSLEEIGLWDNDAVTRFHVLNQLIFAKFFVCVLPLEATCSFGPRNCLRLIIATWRSTNFSADSDRVVSWNGVPSHLRKLHDFFLSQICSVESKHQHQDVLICSVSRWFDVGRQFGWAIWLRRLCCRLEFERCPLRISLRTPTVLRSLQANTGIVSRSDYAIIASFCIFPPVCFSRMSIQFDATS